MHNRRMPIYLAAAVAVALVLRASGVPYTSLVPFALLLACPLMMMFMMKGMGGMGAKKKTDTEIPQATAANTTPTRTGPPAHRS